MAVDLDDIDWVLIRELQRDGRVTFTELARRARLSASATTERVRRLESEGVLVGYRAQIDIAAVGIPLQAVVRLKYFGNHHQPFFDHLEASSHVLECLRITGEDCYIIRLVATSMPQMQQFVDDLARFGDATTSIVYTETLPRRGPTAPLA